jgi:2-iminoacetate synthase ThiH
MQKLDNKKILTYVDRIQKERINLLKNIPLSGPLMVHLEPTNICNFKCKFCPQSLDDYKDKARGFFNLSSENFTKILNELKKVPKLKSLNFLCWANRSLTKIY